MSWICGAPSGQRLSTTWPYSPSGATMDLASTPWPPTGLAQHAESGARGCNGAARIHLLQRDHIRMMPQDGLDHAGKIEPAVGAEPAVDVPRHHPHRPCGGPRDGGCVTS